MTTTRHALNSKYALVSEMRLITGKYVNKGLLKLDIETFSSIFDIKNVLPGLV